MDHGRPVGSEVFLDTAYAIAISSPRDEHRPLARELARRIRADGTRIVTTQAVIIEIGNALAKAHFRAVAVDLMDVLEEDPTVEIVPVTDDLYAEGAALYRTHKDKEWGMTDCLSFVVMRRRGITEALTSDDHFRQAGFRALLREQ
ncbi:type II toxin-antitoxin system VapC family toxin [Longimicrobium sp.]|uniref:type II toxin-antitoxin system VapC family toxin n=1 Tax=Longimicrobium sp. TaxID=2029185 RepID=UPI003B3A03C0